MEDNTFDLNDLPEEVVNEILEGEVLEVAPEEILAEEPAPVVEEVIKPTTTKKRKSDNEIIDELVVAAEKKVVKKTPGIYYENKVVDKIVSRLGKKWVLIINGERVKALKDNIEIVE